MLAAIDFTALGKVIAASLVAGTLITVAFSFSLYTYGIYDDMRRAGRRAAGAPFAAVSALSMGVFLGAVILGLIVMTQK